jgi:hypothetical protein
MRYTRRDVGKLALAAIPAANLVSTSLFAEVSRGAKPSSNFAGVQVGMNVPYNFGGRDMNAGELLDRCLQLGVNALELRSQPVERFLGSPMSVTSKATRDDVRQWRTSLPPEYAGAFRRKFEEAGVRIEIVKYDGIYNMSDGEVDYCFGLAKALRARAISCEIDVQHTKRIGQFADRHQLMVGYHGHATTTPQHWEAAFSYAKFNGANLDLGHFLAGNNTSPVPFLKQHHARITHVHVKDRKMNNGPNMPFGQGDTPIREALQVIRDNKWNIQATIEFEYPIPAGSDRMKELTKCVAFCKEALIG